MCYNTIHLIYRSSGGPRNLSHLLFLLILTKRKVICLIGTVLKDRYCVMERIGQGGGGSLYLARDMELGVFRAVKETSIIRKQEAKLMRFLEHPAIPKIVDYVEEEEFCYLIMEYIRGQSLGEILKNKGDFSIEETLRLGNEIAKVLEYLHSRKPAVVMET